MAAKNNFFTLIKLRDFIMVPLLLLLLWLVVSFLFDRDASFLLISFDHSSHEFISIKNTKLLAGQKVIGKFTARENNLGTIGVRFSTYRQINDDVLIFRLKEIHMKGWMYVAKYRVDQFQPDQLFPFGFPVITNSKNKTYLFEIESTLGKINNAVSINYDEPVYVTKYKFTKSELLTDKRKLVIFLFEKLTTSFQRLDFLIISLTYLVPIILSYLLWLRIPERFLSNNVTLFYLFCILNFLNILVLDLQIELILFILLGLWLLIIKIYHLNHSVSYTLSFAYLAIVPCFVLIRFDSIAEGFALWSYLFLLVGTLQLFLETKFLRTYTVSYKIFFTNVWQKTRGFVGL